MLFEWKENGICRITVTLDSFLQEKLNSIYFIFKHISKISDFGAGWISYLADIIATMDIGWHNIFS